MSIILLDPRTINRIAAGEVIECPASVVKELVENSIDAKATAISITIERGGRNLIIVSDNGIGIKKEDMEIAFARHATSKLPDGDLTKVRSLGFRGEGLTSIAAVGKVKMVSKYRDSDTAWLMVFEGGEKTQELTPDALSCGTYIEVRDLFFATPNRLKFLRTEKAEVQSIIDMMNKLAMVNHNVMFSLFVDNKQVFKYLTQQSNIDRLSEIKTLGMEFCKNSLPVNVKEEQIQLSGYIGSPTLSRGKSSLIYTFVNSRPVYDNLLIGAVRYAYSDFIEKDKYPVVVLYLDIPCDQVDANVHPNKSEVRFQDKKLVYRTVVNAIKEVLSINLNTKLKSISEFENDHFVHASMVNSRNIGNSVSSEFFKCFQNRKPLLNNDVQKYSSKNVETNDQSLLDTNVSFCTDSKMITNKLKEERVYENSREHINKGDSKIEVSNFDILGEKKNFVNLANNLLQESPSIDSGEFNTSKKVPSDSLIDTYPLGYALCQIHSRYIISQTQDSIVIIDQHAAHERLTYEYMKQVMAKEGIKRQILLIPEIIEMNNHLDLELLVEYKEKLLKLGLLIEPLGNLSVIVREVPALFGSFDVKSLIINIVDSIMEVGDTLFLDDKIKDICGTIACYSSIRSGRKLKIEEMNAILRNMENTAHSGQCNHGRPTYVELNLVEIDRLFSRR
ncbi:DNA mismatch repair MutL family protein [Ehrlichia chaffeensis str. Heartland]|uniref:DNA mismatch repair endonuclease MutL n=1 Tax=Ehrlichia chaffeensis TaxID=945 RepID=UPI000444E17C|nr:DNA mismatch repair endonuclease MutL [Ehrlichia chaffeensis]AHX03927.1 DNA mismatch repair MutL family protein [Ehrlichia chaffeensis str. Heartland]AHX07504.1 DNA mismatch repair MutL family protein [Ehrlichia chaffeensis str. Osceola]AHX08974.1 DNA mismatch repair MutL family protein [Ehrlichia chaffeensis str. Saint Vincent]AHX10740.1 DNA mismatch repair MutL family protein [Ehrlichia chaffeensis str. West Paces]